MTGIERQQRQGHVLIAQQRRRIAGTDQAETGLLGFGDPADELVLAVGLAGNSKSRHRAFTPAVGLGSVLLRQCAALIKRFAMIESAGAGVLAHEFRVHVSAPHGICGKAFKA